MKIVCTLLAIGVCCLKIASADIDTAKAIQIVAPVDHSFQLKADELKPILESVEIRDRNVVVISIAGAFRQGKSFLLNFFIKYLYAQVNWNFFIPFVFSNFFIFSNFLNFWDG